uniref:Poly(RC)-binding protein 2/3/4 n=1 Tax=Kwoniella dejecticola CBS 10117 TaxID=1296121 RepID=A0A1A6ACK6_9TREE|nr:poly(rC)-binding protein 2/3/4 [Kwoniella dejecticola CBS 10117]OBR87785.1 poly(rC)-binding protein 2/3/4 [Kwoniella dejecticola CBS 10117]
MSDVTTPSTAVTNKRPASPSPSADNQAQTSAKRAKPDGETEKKEDETNGGNENGNGEEATKKKMDADAEGADAGPSSTLAPPPASVPAAPVKSEAPPQQISMRSLIVTQDASIIIGRGGAHVNEIREKSSARVTVSESIPGNPERILNVSGPLDAVAKAFGLIVRRINDEPFDVASVPGSRAVTIKFIIPNSRMGSVIGKGGSKIKEIQEASGARLNASEAMLPGSTERVLSVSGVADAVHIAVYYIGTILLEYQERNPGAASGSYRQVGARNGPGGPDPNAPPPPGMQTQQIFIPNSLVGAIIGKGGSKINEIRGQSQCNIRVTDPGTAAPGTVANPEERLVTITGYPHNINTAVSLLYARVEQERAKMIDQNHA